MRYDECYCTVMMACFRPLKNFRHLGWLILEQFTRARAHTHTHTHTHTLFTYLSSFRSNIYDIKLILDLQTMDGLIGSFYKEHYLYVISIGHKQCCLFVLIVCHYFKFILYSV